ncbi:hypothetical protein [Alkalilacustris brevis]|uniref:hypothetical protein n=1 Tax=Alkalilacustris brevis TaxID=2026338 RepID=UPI000E0DF43E|nr:hypothetical protein [Alkalilacustris brevis]
MLPRQGQHAQAHCAASVTANRGPAGQLTLMLGLALLLAMASPLAAGTVCHTGFTGTTVCADGSISRTTLHGTTIDNAGNVRRTTLMGVTLSSDGTAIRTHAGAAAGLPDADGRLWNSDPFPASAGPIGGVGCDTGRLAHHLCN